MGYYSYMVYLLPALILALFAQWNVKSTFNRYNRQFSSRGLTGADVARQILDSNGLHDVRVEPIKGSLNDHYDPRVRVVRLSTPVYSGKSVAAIGVAAHECGHAVQHSVNYQPLNIRNAIIPITQFGSSASIWFVIIGMLLTLKPLVLAGIIFFSFAVLFQIITLPVEFNASSRAVRTLDDHGILYGDELAGAKKVLGAAALTYVAATVVAFAQLFRLLAIYSGMNRRDS